MAQRVEFKTRSPVVWTALSALVPFALLVWFHKTNRQLNRLNQRRGHGRRILNPWWLTAPTLAMTALAVAAIVSFLAAGADPAMTADSGRWLLLAPADWPVSTLILSLAALAVGLAAAVAYLVYLLAHIEAVVALAGSDKDKTLLVLMAILSLVSVAYLVLFVVYKSQMTINQAVAGPAGDRAV